jgi:hypothetical protein
VSDRRPALEGDLADRDVKRRRIMKVHRARIGPLQRSSPWTHDEYPWSDVFFLAIVGAIFAVPAIVMLISKAIL